MFESAQGLSRLRQVKNLPEKKLPGKNAKKCEDEKWRT
jgi:hypothetical protein